MGNVGNGRRLLRWLVGVTGAVLLVAGGVALWRAIAARQPTESLIVDVGRRPEVLVAAAVVALGLACFVLLPLLGWAAKREEPASAARDAHAPAPAAAAVPVEVVLDGLLLNLPREADVSGIEDAPPLGARDAVLGAVAEALPGVEFDAAGTGVFTRPGYTIRVTCDAGDPVPTAVVRAHGDGGVLPALRRLTGKTGWRLFVPRRNAFLDALRDEEWLSALPRPRDAQRQSPPGVRSPASG